MSVEALSTVPSFSAAETSVQRSTYSIAPSIETVATEMASGGSAKLELFLEGENPLGCIRGVIWMMVFNAAVFLLGALIWESCKLLF